MSAAVFDLEIDQGATKVFEVQYKDAAGVPISLDGFRGRGEIRNHSKDANPIASFAVDIIDSQAGLVRISLAANALEGIRFPGQTHKEKFRAAYDIELYTANNETVIRLINGACYISPEVTR